MSNIVIRGAAVADLPAIARLWREFIDFHRDRDPHFARAADGHEKFVQFVGRHMESNDSLVLVAEDGAEAVGYCLAAIEQYPPVYAHRNYGFVADLAVTARCRRKGVGEQLFHAAEAWFREKNVDRIELRIAVANEVSTAFWRKMGFIPYVVTSYKDLP